MGLIRDIFRGFGLGLGFKLSDDVYEVAKDAIVNKEQNERAALQQPVQPSPIQASTAPENNNSNEVVSNGEK